ncbi:C39 family peptidase [Flavobacterium olei]|uniref:C39 family peptidase n=1 Tax=Flavobacterium olei TaxID=1886782 RepID=UPI003219C7AF
MVKTNKKLRNEINDLDLEIIDPIESKTILGGYLYDENPGGGWSGDGSSSSPPNGGYYNNGDGITIIGHGSGGSNSGSYGDWGSSGWGQDHSSQWDYGNGQNQGGGGGDYSYVDTTLPNLPQYPPVQQYKGACVMTSASFVASLFGSVQSPEFMMSEYGSKNNMNQMQHTLALFNGLGHDQQVAFLLQQFNMTGLSTVTEMTAAIDRGHPVMGVIMVGQNTGHEVTIVGYDYSTGNFTIADTIYGGYSYVGFNAINTSMQSWEITGVK